MCINANGILKVRPMSLPHPPMNPNIRGTTLQRIVNLRTGGFIGFNDLQNILRILRDLKEDPHKSYSLVSLFDHCKAQLGDLPDDLQDICHSAGLLGTHETSLFRETRDVILSCVEIQKGEVTIIDPTK